jgi:alkylhydroperoxidase family enzyme
MDEDRTFLAEPEPTEPARGLYAEDLDGDGYVMNLTRLWAHAPAVHDGIVALLDAASSAGGLTFRQKGILVSAAAATLGDSYCSLAWGTRLAGEVDDETAATVLTGDDTGLDPGEQALARWARAVARDPNATTPDEVQALRDAGFDDAQIFAVTAYVAGRVAFSTVNDALGARPDAELLARTPDAVRAAVAWGRPPAQD